MVANNQLFTKYERFLQSNTRWNKVTARTIEILWMAWNTERSSASEVRSSSHTISNAMRTRYAHEVTVVVLNSLMKRAYEDSGTKMTSMRLGCVYFPRDATFKYKLLGHSYQQIIFMFVREHRESKFELMVSNLRKFVPLFFALDHQNYTKCIPMFIRDMEVLPDSIQAEFEK